MCSGIIGRWQSMSWKQNNNNKKKGGGQRKTRVTRDQVIVNMHMAIRVYENDENDKRRS